MVEEVFVHTTWAPAGAAGAVRNTDMTSRHSLLIVDPDPSFLADVTPTLGVEGFAVRGASDLLTARRLVDERMPDAVVVEQRLADGLGIDFVRELRARTDAPVIVMTAMFPDTRAVVEAVREGALDVLEKPVFAERLAGVLLPAVEEARTRGDAPRESAPPSDLSRPPIIGDAGAIAAVREQITRVAATPSTTVLIQGESGTGKELVARAVHFDGRRAKRPFMAINCAALNENILEAELFGYEKGSFTGANTNGKQGLLEAADGGSVFLDEIGEMSPGLQAKVLRFLQDSTFKRVGGVKDIRVDVRIIAATNRELWDDVRRGTFRKDLFFRLNVMPIRVPALRERRGDVKALAEHFLRRFAVDLRKSVTGFSLDALRMLESHDWPGNVRELRNTCEYAVIVCDGGLVEPRHLALPETRDALSMTASETAPNVAAPSGAALALRDRSIKSVEEDLIRLVLNETKFNITRASRELGINRSTLYAKMKAYGLETAEPLGAAQTA